MSIFKPMSDWCMFKDYNGAERFSDGSRPLMAETERADIIISGIPDKSEVTIGVYPYGDVCDYFYEGTADTKEQAEQIGLEIADFIKTNSDAQFTDGTFKSFYSGLQLTDVRTQDHETKQEYEIKMGGM